MTTKDSFQTLTSEQMNRKGDFIRTYTGLKFWPIDPRPEDVIIKDIAHSLSLKVRWQGFCKYFYSVGTHSLRVAALAKYFAGLNKLDEELLYSYGLAHDAVEAYLPDVPTPVKPYIAEWKDIENRVESAIFKALNLPPYTPEIKAVVKQADRVLLKLESEELFDGKCDNWPALENIHVTMDMRIYAATISLEPKTVENLLEYDLLRVKDRAVRDANITLSSC